MKFCSIRGESPDVQFREALFRGLAPDGSLYIPRAIPSLPSSVATASAPLHLPVIAAEILGAFIDEIPPADLKAIAQDAFSFPIPLVKLEGNLYLLELFHGPTLAFKDVGTRFMARALSYFLKSKQQKLTIAVATSGDTGSAVAHGFHNVPNISVFVFYPSGKISRLQEQQMTTLGGNIHAVEIEGTFDDCQFLVKRALTDHEVVQTRNLTTANSINLGRLIPQITYYCWALLQLRESTDEARSGSIVPPMVVVPSGNFGNLTAAVYAKHMGAAISSFISASNANDVVPEYFRTGVFRPRPSLQTHSNAMDVGNPSNFARLEALYRKNPFQMKRDIAAVSISDPETIDEIRRTYERTGYVLDPHTAVGVAAARGPAAATSSPIPIIVAATAHPGKFPEVVSKALGTTAPLPEQLQEAMRRPKHSTRLPAVYNEIRRLLLS
jgi:threonine synthase